MEILQKYTVKISEKFDVIARVLFMVILILVVTNVISRSFGYPLNGVSEWVGFLMASAIALAISYCAALEGHVSVSILIDRLPFKKKASVEIIVGLFILVFLVFMVRMLTLYGIRLQQGGHIGMTTKVPLYPFAYVTALGFASYCVVMAGKLLEYVKRVSKR